MLRNLEGFRRDFLGFDMDRIYNVFEYYKRDVYSSKRV